MSEQMRSADLLVTSALADPKVMDELKVNPEKTLKDLAQAATNNLPRVPPPDEPTTNIIWIIVVGAFVVVMLWSSYVLGMGVTNKIEAGIYVTKGETVLTLFTTVVAFLAGLMSPSPVRR